MTRYLQFSDKKLEMNEDFYNKFGNFLITSDEEETYKFRDKTLETLLAGLLKRKK